MTLTRQVALITGGTRMGEALARALAARGANVAVAYGRSRDEADRAVAAVEAVGAVGVALQADLANPDGARGLVAGAVDRLGGLDIAVNMASTYVSRPFDTLTVDDWDRALEVDLRGTFLVAQAAVPHMRARGGGRIVNVSDWTAVSRRPRYHGFLPYYVAKAGVIALTEALALELAADRILVNAVAPGPILAPPAMTEDERRAVERATPLGRWGGPEALVATVMSLIESDFITGETIRVDGGRHLL
jgi:NAD(P)-dependent dehydrogenase (short-subunit alcohol dehydrogenase family)